MGFSSGTLASAGLLTQGLGVVNKGLGAYYSAQAQKSSLEFDAKIAKLQADNELRRGEQEIGRLTLKAGQVKGATRAALAANGVDLGVGNAAEVLATQDVMKDIDVNTLKRNAMLAAFGYKSQAIFDKARASTISPVGSAFGTLLGGVGAVADAWYKFKSTAPDPGNYQIGTPTYSGNFLTFDP